MENGLVNLINRSAPERYRHAVICMTDFTDFRDRIRRPDVTVHPIGKRPGRDPAAFWRLLALLRRLAPDILHSRNLSALDSLLPALIAGVRIRIHGEHGRDADDPDGTRRKLIWLRRLHSPLVTHYVTVSNDLERYLVRSVGIAPRRVRRLYNGVDIARFSAAAEPLRDGYPDAFRTPGQIVFGYVGRFQAVKDPGNLIEAFHLLRQAHPELRDRLRLAMIGDGPLLDAVRRRAGELDIADAVWFAGPRDDIPALLRGLDVYVLPSVAEGISNSILEAMASGLPVVATRVGGNAELVVEGRTGVLVPRQDPAAMARAMAGYAGDPALRRRQGAAARQRAENDFSLDAMTRAYLGLYDEALAGLRRTARRRAVQ